MHNSGSSDLVCFSHLRWDFVFQRPQHLLSRFAQTGRVFYVEEPVFGAEQPHLESAPRREGVEVVTPHLPGGWSSEENNRVVARLLAQYRKKRGIFQPVLWYYTPMALLFSRDWDASLVVYDCMDELSAFLFAPPELLRLETELFARADLVFTGGYSLYEAKRRRHRKVFPFPSSVDIAHFHKARTSVSEPTDQARLSGPKIGYFGVIDERMDLQLLTYLAEHRPGWQFVMVGPTCKISDEMLPRRSNVHFLGKRGYEDLPAYLSGWDAAIIPFALNESTRFISPTKGPEYLAAGRPVVSTAIRDVVEPYENLGLISIGRTHAEFLECLDRQLALSNRAAWQAKVDEFLAQTSWDETWGRMASLIRVERLRKENLRERGEGKADATAVSG